MVPAFSTQRSPKHLEAGHAIQMADTHSMVGSILFAWRNKLGVQLQYMLLTNRERVPPSRYQLYYVDVRWDKVGRGSKVV